jgi:Skp family chaperone for outer membrane proteins
MRVRAAAAALSLLLVLPLPAVAQSADTGQAISVPSPILTLDQERFFAGSAWGKRAAGDIEAASLALAAENRRIEAELTAEERALTDERATLTPEAFRPKADAFDAKVVAIRADQDRKARDLAELRDTERNAFFAAALPVLGEVLRERGAVAILDARAIFIAANAIDVTDQMIVAVDKSVGAGPVASPAPTAPDAPPETPPAPGSGGN